MKQRKRYTPEFKAQVVELANAGRSVTELAKDFDLNAGLIHTWKRNASASSPLQVRSGVQGAEGDMDAAEELKRLRREVNKLRIDNDILKKAAIILGTSIPNKHDK